MASSFTTRSRLEKQGTGENTNTWGTKLNGQTIDMVDESMDGRTTFTLSGSKTLTSSNGATDEARKRFLDITSGTGGTVTIPAVEKLYLVRNACSGDVVLTTGSGVTATVEAGALVWVVCDGTNVRREYDQKVYDDAKDYADALAFSAAAGNLPGQTGNGGKSLVTDGAAASWGYAQKPFTQVTGNITLAAKTDYAVDTSAARALALPAASGSFQSIRIADATKQAASNNITVTRDGTDTIDGDTTFVIDLNGGEVTLVDYAAGAWRAIPG